MNNTVYVLDTETSNTGWKDGRPKDGHIVEIGIAQVDLEAMTVKQLYGYIVRDETADRKAWVFNNTTLDYDEVLNGHDRSMISRMLAKQFAGESFTSYNIEFDRYMLQKDMPLFNGCIHWEQDIMERASLVSEIPRKHAGGNCYPRAEAAYNYLCPDDPCHLNGNELHRASADAEMEGYILLELFKRGLWGQEVSE